MLAVALAACSSQRSPAAPAAAPAQQEARPAAAARGPATAAVTDFAFGIIRHTEILQRRNFVISPASIALAMGMTQAGARDETARQIARGTGLSDDDHAWLSTAFRALAQRLGASGHALESANRMFLEQDLTIEPAYQGLLQTRYGAPVQQLDFARDPAASRRHINA